MKGDEFRRRLHPVGDDYMVPLHGIVQKSQLTAGGHLFPSDYVAVLSGPLDRQVGEFRHPYPAVNLCPAVLRKRLHRPRQRGRLIRRNAEANAQPLAFGNDLFVVEPGIHTDVDRIGEVFDFMIALPDEADSSIGGMGIAGTEPAMEPVTVPACAAGVAGRSAVNLSVITRSMAQLAPFRPL